MIPFRDASRRPLTFPIITLFIIVVNFGVFFLELSNGDPFISRWSVIPAHILAGQDWITLLTAMFMHAGWTHILGNMLFLWVFGPEIEDTMGPVRYLLFYLLGGLVASLAQIMVAPGSTIPNLGASGAIAAVMGVFLVTFPHDRIRTLLFIGWFLQVTAIPAIILIGLWFLIQLFSGLGAMANIQTGGVAYMAHVGGFLFGVLAGRLFETARRRAAQGLEG